MFTNNGKFFFSNEFIVKSEYNLEVFHCHKTHFTLRLLLLKISVSVDKSTKTKKIKMLKKMTNTLYHNKIIC